MGDMEPHPDELAGVVDMFGALTRAELQEALAELAFKQGEGYDPDAFADDIATAVEGYYLVPVDSSEAGGDGKEGPQLLVPGPVAFPDLPENAEDLAHIMNISTRRVDRDTAGRAGVERFRTEVAETATPERASTLVDVSYELETWAGVDLSDVRGQLDEQASDE
jgi:hypothetical protein